MLIDEINALYLTKFGRLPNLENPKSYNDIIQWLKLHDQKACQVWACDKLSARQMAPEWARIPMLSAGNHLPNLDYPYVVKTTHDSGTSFVVKDKIDLLAAKPKIKQSMARQYGIGKGEWAYRYITPMIIAEEYVPEASTDYKFHISGGIVRWVQVIWDRGKHTKEAIFSDDGKVMAMHMDDKMVHTPDQGKYPGDAAWEQLTKLALQLAEPYRYVRADLYWAGKPLFGELTFWPRAGCYKSKDQQLFGKMLEMDLSYKLEPICP